METKDFDEPLPDIGVVPRTPASRPLLDAPPPAQAVKWVRAEIAALNRAWALVSLRMLDPVIHARLLSYVEGLARRSHMSWRTERLTKPSRFYRALLVSERGQRVRVYYVEREARWKADKTAHVAEGREENPRSMKKEGTR